MAGVLSDQVVRAASVAPLALTTNPAEPQFLVNGKVANKGNARVFIPGTGRTNKRRFRVIVNGNLTTSVANAVTLGVQINGVTYATSGAKTLNAKSGSVVLITEFLYDSNAANFSGTVQGHLDNQLIAAAPLSITTNVPLDTEGNQAGVVVSVANADAGAVFTLSTLELEIL